MNQHQNILSSVTSVIIDEQILFSVNNPLISSHSVHGRFILPGLAYIDIIFQFLRKKGYKHDQMEIRNLVIHNPLVVEKERKVVVSFIGADHGNGKLKIRIEGRRLENSVLSDDVLLYAAAEVHSKQTQFEDNVFDIPSLKRSHKLRYPITDIYDRYRHMDLVHDGFMKAEGTIYETESGMLFEATLGKEAAPGADQFMFHPTLLDASAVATMRLCESLVDEKGHIFLPLHYRAFSCSALITNSCLAFVPRSSIKRNNEIISLTINFADNKGKKIGELTNLTTKIVRQTLGSPSHQQAISVNNSAKETEEAKKQEITLYLKQLIADALKVGEEAVSIKAGYYDLGLDSARLLSLVDVIGTKINVDLSPTLFFEYSNISLLADHLFQEYADKFELQSKAVKNLNGHPGSSHRTDRLSDGNEKPQQDNTMSCSDVAIIGIAGRYPQARDIHEFWENLKTGKDSISKVPDFRWDPSMHEHIKSPSGKNISPWGGFIEEPDLFDPMFFRISAREAEVMDPQERLFLQACWHALEDAGYTPDTLVKSKTGRRKVGVFAGVMHKDYALIGNEAILNGGLAPLSLNNASIANRVSYCCDFHGPSMVVDTACSSSLVAIHLALQSILSGESDVAIAGGVNLSLHPGKYISYGLVDMHSSDGRCKAFGKGGDGYVSAEGVGAILLKPLQKAMEDGDQIYAVIKGSSVNHVGSVSGMMVPSPVAQGAMIKDCLERSGIDPRTIGYIEAHGTGTSLGDPIEIQGLIKAFSAYTADKQFCSIGSVKSNIGHAEAAAGISGLTKLALQFKHGMLVPSLHAEEGNPYIDLKNSPFYIQQKLGLWKGMEITRDGIKTLYPRRAGISSFGASGTNAHIILEEYCPKDEAPETSGNGVFLIPVSAKNKENLHQTVENLFRYVTRLLSNSTPVCLLDVAYTLQVGRVEMNERMIFIADDLNSLIGQLRGYLNNDSVKNCFQGNVKHRVSDALTQNIAPLREFIENGINASNVVRSIAESWVKGSEVKWNDLYEGNRLYGRAPRRISLPGYPFSKERYWIPQHLPTASKTNSIVHPQETERKVASFPVVATGELDEELLLGKVTSNLKVLFAGIVKYSVDHIDEREMLENYGIDSIMIVELNKALAEIYGELSSTLFYEYQTLYALSMYLVRDHRDLSTKWTGMNVPDNFQTDDSGADLSKPVAMTFRNGHSSLNQTQKVVHSKPETNEPIAIIGINGRYAQADNLKQFWENLKSGKDCITEIPDERWSMDNFFHADSAAAASLGKSYGKWGSFIDGFADFDPSFFNISPKEAKGMDPHIRIFLESCWHVLEDAGYSKQSLSELYNGNVGVFAGITRTGFSFYAPELIKNGQYPLNSLSAVANRVSYLLNLKGPSVPVDTMCSSSLTAVHDACESLRAGRCAMAIAGGVNLLLHPTEYVMLSANNFLSTDGKCRSFGTGGDGYVPGEGVGTVLLKPLSRAIDDNDHIYAVIKSTSVNHGGKTNGYTVPNPVAQGELIRNALDLAGISASEVSYIEAHGTGTPLGDPIEITGLTQAFRSDTADTMYCAIGSLKSNIGHLEAAAGIAGLTKIVLQLQHGMLVPSLHANVLNPNINFSKSPFYVQQTLSEWKRPVSEMGSEKKELSRIAGISSFGAGGANAHVIIEEYIPSNPERIANTTLRTHPVPDPFVVLLSAKNEERLKVYALELMTEIGCNDIKLDSLAYTLQVGREPMDVRLALEVRSVPELVEKLEAFTVNGQMQGGMFFGKIKDHKEAISGFYVDKEMVAAVKTWIDTRSYERLMSWWVKGLSIDWNQLYKSELKPKRAILPVYPFDRKKYWIAGTETRQPEVTNQVAQEKIVLHNKIANATSPAAGKKGSSGIEEENFQLLTFEEVWEEKPIGTPAHPGSAIKTLVCFVSEQSNQKSVRSAINDLNKGVNVIFITLSNSGDGNYVPHNPEISGSYKSIFNDIIKGHGEIDAIIYLWPLEDRAFIRNYESLVAILQGIAACKLKTKHFMLAGSWTTGVAGQDLDRCYLESWIGFERSLKIVLPDVILKSVYQELPDSDIDIKEWMLKIWEEIHQFESRSALYKGDKRYLHQVRTTQIASGQSGFRKGGTYLITGGLGNLGLLVARRLAERFSANLILTGRSSLNSKKQDEINKLKTFGGSVIYLQADICNEADMREKLEIARASAGPIQGVIHTAGLIGTETLLEKNYASFQKILDPKVTGTILLDDLLRDEPLDVVCYFTSSSAILGDFGACDYSIANRFQMAFATYRNQLVKRGLRKGNSVAINWPLWKDGGMDLNDAESTKMYLKSSGQRYLMAQEGLDVLEQIIASGSEQQLVLAGLESKMKRFLGLQSKPERAGSTDGMLAVKTRRPWTTGRTIAQCLEHDLMELVSVAQQIPREDLLPDENLADLGFDSISLTDLARALSKHFAVQIAPAVFFGYSTIEKLKEYFLKEHKQAIESVYRDHLKEEIDTEGDEYSPVITEVKVSATSNNPIAPQPLKEPVAIIGMSGRFPEARNVGEMWKILVEGKDAVKEIPVKRFDWRKYYSPDDVVPGKTNCKWSGLAPGIEEFDARFFEITPQEAELMDPRQRLLLQEAWNALEDAGYGPSQIKKEKIGLYVGAEESSYAELTGQPGLTSNHNGILAARLSYFMNLSGPNMAINTACSSGLVAAHQAFQSLQTGDCDTALAAGVNLMLVPELYVGMTQAGMLSPDGKCRTFDKNANGMVPGEAAVVVVMKLLSKALADGDPVYAVIRGSGLNYDGKTNGITAPNGLSQAELFKSVYNKFQIDPGNIEYIVTHGTGTRLGDPVEVNALVEAFKERGEKRNYCALTSTKTNFGHTFSASGLVSLVSLVMSLKHEVIPASLHCTEENDYIKWSESPFYVNKSNRAWRAESGKARIGAVSAFGMSGTNAHMVVQGFEGDSGIRQKESPFYLMPFSAKTPEALKAKIADLLVALEDTSLSESRMTDISYTLLAGRHHFRYRAAIVVCDREEAICVLKQQSGKIKQPNFFQGEVHREFKELNSVSRYIRELSGSGNTTSSDVKELQENFFALADFYCQGYEIPFEKLYEQSEPKRIHLPAYPFATDHYWFNVDSTISELPIEAAVSGVAALQDKNDHNLVSVLPDKKNKTLLFEPYWAEKPVSGNTVPFHFPQHIVVCCDQNKVWKESLQNALQGIEIVDLKSAAVNFAERFEEYTISIFERIQALIREHANVPVLLQVIVPAQDQQQLLQGISGLLKTVRQEHMNIKCQLMALDENTTPDEMVKRIRENGSSPDDAQVSYTEDRRFVLEWKPLLAEVGITGERVWRENGIYLITGGAGGIGLTIAKAIAQMAKRSTIILTGRSPLDESKKTRIENISVPGINIRYRQLDVTRKEDVSVLIDSVQKEYGALHGIIHSAGVIHDSLLLNKTRREWESVLAPKVHGLWNLDEATKNMPLDFFVTFSSVAGVMGNAGQADYAAANAFMDAFAGYRNSLLSLGKRSGHSISINWPLWKEGGMNVNEATEERLEMWGLALLDSSAAINAFYEAVEMKNSDQVMILHGDEHIISGKILAKHTVEIPNNSGSKRKKEMQGFSVAECVDYELKIQVSRLSKIPEEKVDILENLTDMGFDSISLTKLSTALSKYFGIEITPALFFGYPSIEKLTAYFLEQHRSLMEEFYTENTAEREPARVSISESNKTLRVKSPSNERRRFEAVRSVGFPVPEPIAIIGMSGRFPDARNVDEMWEILVNGKDAVREIPEERFDCQKYYSEHIKPGKTNCKWSGLIPGIREFDPMFFEISPKEAALMDPRQRLLLQEAWNALEDAGYGDEHIRKSKIGMYVGAEESSYTALTGSDSSITSSNSAILAARISYFLNLSGPNMAINTACSSALVAVHQACVSLRNFECDTALAAGVNLLYTPEPYIAMSKAGMMSATGKCYAFDKRANGMVPGESVAVVVLKRLSKAIEDGDPIYATIQGSGINYDGKTNGITAPSGISQTALLKSVYDLLDIHPEKIEYIVTHGTGTLLGDPIEINALNDAFRKYTSKQSYCALTSSKTNFGHTMAASGLVSLINLVQAFTHETIPASLHCEEENNYINWKESPFYVNKKNKPWNEDPTKERIGAVSSFGMSGTNAHIVLGSYSVENSRKQVEELPVHLLVLSAKTNESLSEKVNQMIMTMENKNLSGQWITDIAYTLLAGRHHFKYRCAVVVRDKEDAIYTLRQFLRNDKRPTLFRGEAPYDFRGQAMVKEYIIHLAGKIQDSCQNTQRCQEILSALAEFYCQGYEIPSEVLCRNFNAQRVHLPGYPFARENYWVSEEANAEITQVLKDSPAAGELKSRSSKINGNSSSQNNPPETINEKAVPVAVSNARNENDVVKEGTAPQHLFILMKSYLMKFISSATNVPLERMEAELSLAHFGVDSIMMVQLRNSLEETFSELPSDLFFEYPSIHQLTEYFVREHRELLPEFLKETRQNEGSPQSYLYETKQVSPGEVGRNITALIASVINLHPDKMDSELLLEHYGIDSIMMVQLKAQLENVYGELPDNVLYEYPTIRDLTQYILNIKEPVLAELKN